MLEPTEKPLKIFYCYAHEDKALRDTLDSHLSALKRQKLIEIWHDGEITAGTEWENEISKHLSTADIVLLLVSADFLRSDYCYSKEMTRALQRHREGTTRVIPIILRPVDWKDTPFSNLQILPTGAEPVTRWKNPDDAYEDIAKNLRVVVKNLHISQKTADINGSVSLNSLQTPSSPQIMMQRGEQPPLMQRPRPYEQPSYQPYPPQPHGQNGQAVYQPSSQPSVRGLGFSWAMIALSGGIAASFEGAISQGNGIVVVIGFIIPIIAGFIASKFTSRKWTGTIAGFIPMIVLSLIIESIDYPHVIFGGGLLTTAVFAAIGMLLGFVGGWLATLRWK